MQISIASIFSFIARGGVYYVGCKFPEILNTSTAYFFRDILLIHERISCFTVILLQILVLDFLKTNFPQFIMGAKVLV